MKGCLSHMNQTAGRSAFHRSGWIKIIVTFLRLINNIIFQKPSDRLGAGGRRGQRRRQQPNCLSKQEEGTFVGWMNMVGKYFWKWKNKQKFFVKWLFSKAWARILSTKIERCFSMYGFGGVRIKVHAKALKGQFSFNKCHQIINN